MRDLFYAFKKATNFDIRGYIDKATNFFKTDYYKIEDFISGKVTLISPLPFITLKELQKENKEIFSLWQLNKDKFNTTEWYELLDIIEEFDSRILTTLNLNKWLRVSNNNFGSDNIITVKKTLSQNETLERVSQAFTGSNPEGWVNIAKDNNLSELSYSIEGGKEINIKGTQITYVNQLTSIVDVIDGKSIYGLDIDRHIQFYDDDLKVLDYDNTAIQSVSILMGLKQNDNPDEPSNGIQSSIVIGTNRNLLNFPIIIRQMSETFSTDDSLINFKVEGIKIIEDKVSIDIVVMTRDSKTIQKNVQF